jgi:hypothetical protein
MTDLVQCPRCESAFLMLPGTCPACHEHIEAPAVAAGGAGGGGDRVVSSRLNQTAAVGGVMIAGLLTAMGSWFLVAPEMGLGLLLLAVMISVVILWRG